MKLKFKDFNGADVLFAGKYHKQWDELSETLENLPLYLKASDQSGLQGNPIFDPVGTNAYIKKALKEAGWHTNLPIPTKFSFLGTDVDFVCEGLVVEVQFSNYPYLLNNVTRSELFSKANVKFIDTHIDVVTIVTKGHMFPASNGTLYYEQAVRQVQELSKYGVCKLPIRIVGLFEDENTLVNARWVEYSAVSRSRTVKSEIDGKCFVKKNNNQVRCMLTFESELIEG